MRRFSNGAHGYLKLFAVAPKRTKDLAGKALRMNAHQRRGVRQIPQEQRERSFDSLFAARNVPLKGKHLKQTQPGRYLSGDNSSECSGLCDWYRGAPPDHAKSQPAFADAFGYGVAFTPTSVGLR
jgi:hypothetical protein